jgi:hypothetical protein
LRTIFILLVIFPGPTPFWPSSSALCSKAEANTAKAAHPVAFPLDMMALSHIENALDQRGQLAKKDRLANRLLVPR